jgi:hypothetical protein
MMAKESKAFGSQRAQKAHLLLGSGGLSSEINDLRRDTEEGFQNLEGRAGFPALNYGEAPVAAGGDVTLTGENLLQGQTFDSLALWSGTSMVTITALTPGDSPFTIEITDGATAGSEVVTKTLNAFVIQIEAGVSTADQIATALNADGADSDGYLRAASGGAGVTNAVAAATAMAGGVGSFAENVVKVGGVECLPANTTGTAGAAAWSDTAIIVTVPAMAGAAGKLFQVEVMSDGTSADPMSTIDSTAGTAATGAAQADATTALSETEELRSLVGFPEIDYIDGAGPAAAGGDMVIVGRNLLQGQTFDELALWSGTSMVTIMASKPGVSGYTIEITDGATAGSEVVTKTGDAFVIQIEAGVSTADQIATALNADGADSDGYLWAVSGGSGTTNAIAAATPMAGGTGTFAGNVVRAAGFECLPANTTGATGVALWSNTSIAVTVPALSPVVATDKAAVSVSSNSVRAQSLSVAVE